MSEVSKIDNNLNIKIPDEIIKKSGLKPGTEVIWMYNEEYNQLIIKENPFKEWRCKIVKKQYYLVHHLVHGEQDE